MRRLLGCCVLVLVFLGSVVAAPRAGRAAAVAELSPPAGEALQVLITTRTGGGAEPLRLRAPEGAPTS